MSIFRHDLIIKLAARYKLPTVYYERFFVAAGGLISYGVDRIDQYRQAAGYVDRILRGRSGQHAGASADKVGARPHCAADAAGERR
jgi:ABC-type uncharacterized transport system substrate-binding protein